MTTKNIQAFVKVLGKYTDTLEGLQEELDMLENASRKIVKRIDGEDMSELALLYRLIRDEGKKAASDFSKAREDAMKQCLKILDDVVMARFTTNTRSMATEGGTVTRKTVRRPSIGDKSVYAGWIRESDEAFPLEDVVGKPTVGQLDQYMADHDGELPPGIKVHNEYTVSVTKPKSTK